MNAWLLGALVCVAWILWILASLLQHANAKLAGRLAPDAGLSLEPIISLVPVGLIGVATVVDYFVAPWGSWVIGGLHGLLAVASIVGIVRAAMRLRGLSDEASPDGRRSFGPPAGRGQASRSATTGRGFVLR